MRAYSSFSYPKVLIIGKASYIGADLAMVLLKNRAKITISGDFSNVCMSNIKESTNKITVVKGGTRDFGTLKIELKTEPTKFSEWFNADHPQRRRTA